jgi:hypothetical protein
VEALLAKVPFTCSVPGNLFGRTVRAAIDLNDDALGQARKVDDEMVDRHLLAKLEACAFQFAKFPPQPSFGRCSVLTQLTGSFVRHRARCYPHP